MCYCYRLELNLFCFQFANTIPPPLSTHSRPRNAMRSSDPSLRNLQAALWRHARGRLFSLPLHVRAYVRVEWQRAAAPRRYTDLLRLVQHAAARLGAAPSDFSDLTASTRLGLCAGLDFIALKGGRRANAEWLPSPALSEWLSIDYEQRQLQLAQALSELADDLPIQTLKVTPVLSTSIGDAALTVEIHRLRPDGNQPCDIVWNADLSRRVVFVRHTHDPIRLRDLLPEIPEQ